MSRTLHSPVRPPLERALEEFETLLIQDPETYRKIIALRKHAFFENFSKHGITLEEIETKGLIKDDYDAQSYIFALLHKPSRNFVGSLRITYVNPRTPLKRLPFEKELGYIASDNLLKFELSRFVMLKDCAGYEDVSAMRLHMALMKKFFSRLRFLAYLYQNKDIYVFARPKLSLLLKRIGFNFNKIGDTVSYLLGGVPYRTDTLSFLRDTEAHMGKMTRDFLVSLCQNPEPFYRYLESAPYLTDEAARFEKLCERLRRYGKEASIEVLLGCDTP